MNGIMKFHPLTAYIVQKSCHKSKSDLRKVFQHISFGIKVSLQHLYRPKGRSFSTSIYMYTVHSQIVRESGSEFFHYSQSTTTRS